MSNEILIFNFLTLFSLVSFFVTLFVKNISSKIFNQSLLDNDFLKPQAFHSSPIARSGGMASIISLIIFFVSYYFLFNIFLIDYLILSFSFFFLGFLDDLKINIDPKLRLVSMTVILCLGINYFSIYIQSVDLKFLSLWLSNSYFQKFFILLCFLFIINGSNLIDGFNGLLGMHLLIINVVLLSINIANLELASIIIAQIIVLLCFLLFNFPKAKIFFGDSGSYLFGTLLVLNIINTNNTQSNISSFFYCILLFYLFFEVFFSFFRKIYQRKSPLKPDNDHLHMLSYKLLNKKKFKGCNYLNSIFINLIYIMGVLPSIYFKDNGIICRYWFFTLLFVYLVFYSRLYSFVKK